MDSIWTKKLTVTRQFNLLPIINTIFINVQTHCGIYAYTHTNGRHQIQSSQNSSASCLGLALSYKAVDRLHFLFNILHTLYYTCFIDTLDIKVFGTPIYSACNEDISERMQHVWTLIERERGRDRERGRESGRGRSSNLCNDMHLSVIKPVKTNHTHKIIIFNIIRVIYYETQMKVLT